MAIITISRGFYSRGKEVAEKLAQALGYQCISRDILLEASEQFNIPEIKLIRAIHDAPSILGRFSYEKETFVAYIRAALLRQVEKDNVIYHGLAGHFLLKDLPHVLKVRIIAGMEERVREEMKRENISAEEARRILREDDQERRKWSKHLYGIDTWDPSLYDLVIRVQCVQVDDAVNLIKYALEGSCFQPKPGNQSLVHEVSLAAQIETALIQEIPSVQVEAKGGEIFIYLKKSICADEELVSRIKRLAASIVNVDMGITCCVKPQQP